MSQNISINTIKVTRQKSIQKQGFKFLLKLVNEKLLEKILRQKQTESLKIG